MKRILGVLPALGTGAALLTFSQEQAKIERMSSELDHLLAKDAKVEHLATRSGFKWTEGPVWIPAGYLLFAEIPSNGIYKWSPGKSISVFLHPSGYKGSAPFGGPESGSNGMTLDKTGRLTVAGHAQRNVYRLESMDPKGPITILADTYQGKKLNSPNDLVYKSDGALYFTDPPYGLATQNEKDPEKQLSFSGVYRLSGASSQPAGASPSSKNLQLLIKDLPRPNGIAFSPDEKFLYVNNTEPKKLWMRYSVHSDGTVGEGKVLFDATSDTSIGAPDGMKVDQQGNIYSAGPGGVWIFSPDGKHLGTIRMPEKTGNLTFGDADGKSLYITASSSIYRVRTMVPGIRP